VIYNLLVTANDWHARYRYELQRVCGEVLRENNLAADVVRLIESYLIGRQRAEIQRCLDNPLLAYKVLWEDTSSDVSCDLSSDSDLEE
jgi:hypothetical protein